MSRDNAARLAISRLLQRIHDPGKQRLVPSLLPDGSSVGFRAAGNPVGNGMHDLVPFGPRRQSLTFHRFMMTTSRYSLGTTIVPSSALFMRPMRS